MNERHYSDTRPEKLERISTYLWAYRWDVQEEEREVPVVVEANEEPSDNIEESMEETTIQAYEYEDIEGDEMMHHQEAEPAYYGILSEADNPVIDNSVTEIKTFYNYNEVILNEPISSNKIIETVLSKVMSVSQELKLANDYNAMVIAERTDDVALNKKNRYLEWLTLRDSLKSDIESACQEKGIE